VFDAFPNSFRSSISDLRPFLILLLAVETFPNSLNQNFVADTAKTTVVNSRSLLKLLERAFAVGQLLVHAGQLALDLLQCRRSVIDLLDLVHKSSVL